MSETLAELKSAIFADYRLKTPASRALFDRARHCLPGGVSGNLRFFSPYPLYMRSGEGCVAIDIDDNRYLDCFSCNGPLMLGHRHPSVFAGEAELARVGSLVLNPEILVECAELLQASVPCAEKVRFLNSGTEAVLTAVRLARGYTGKPKIVKFYGHYHGQDDQFLLGVAPNRDPFGAGIPDASFENTLTLPFNQIAPLEQLLSSCDDIAAVILDPAMHSGGLWGADPEFLRAARDLTRDKGVVLIFDEVITGFRICLGGAQAHYGVTPDLATFGKALSGGEKLGAVVGCDAVMAVTDPLAVAGTPRVFQSGTGNDGTMALAAAVGALKEYRRLQELGEYDRLAERTESLEQGMRNTFQRHGIPLHVNRLASMMQLFVSRKVPSFEAYSEIDNAILELFYLALINEGVMLSLPTSNHIYFSFMHDEKAFDEIAEAVSRVLEKYPFSAASALSERQG
ncbi:HemL Glutamate-1-semialdehyde aminotransferase [Sphingomonadaceae bacterium]